MIKAFFKVAIYFFLLIKNSFGSTVGFDRQDNFFESVAIFFVGMLVLLFFAMIFFLYKKGAKVFKPENVNILLWVFQIVYLRFVSFILLFNEPKSMTRGNDLIENFELFLMYFTGSFQKIYTNLGMINVFVWFIYSFYMLRKVKEEKSREVEGERSFGEDG